MIESYQHLAIVDLNTNDVLNISGFEQGPFFFLLISFLSFSHLFLFSGPVGVNCKGTKCPCITTLEIINKELWIGGTFSTTKEG